MKIEFIGFTKAAVDLLPGLSEHSRYNLLVGSRYRVFGLSIVDGIVYLCVISESDCPLWIPAVLTEIADRSLPSDWCISFGDCGVSLVMGPKEYLGDVASYTDFVEMFPGAVDKFWKYIENNIEE